jgi:hypothetical protein
MFPISYLIYDIFLEKLLLSIFKEFTFSLISYKQCYLCSHKNFNLKMQDWGDCKSFNYVCKSLSYWSLFFKFYLIILIIFLCHFGTYFDMYILAIACYKDIIVGANTFYFLLSIR